MKIPKNQKPVRIYYRSLTADGALWCESKSAEEVRERSAGVDVTFQILEVFEVDNGWVKWDTTALPADQNPDYDLEEDN